MTWPGTRLWALHISYKKVCNDTCKSGRSLPAPLQTLEDDKKTKRDFSVFLSRKIQRAIQKEYTAIIQDDGSINEKTLARIVLSVGEDSLLNHGDIREMLDQNVNGEYDEKVKAAMRTAVEQGLPALLQDVNVQNLTIWKLHGINKKNMILKDKKKPLAKVSGFYNIKINLSKIHYI